VVVVKGQLVCDAMTVPDLLRRLLTAPGPSGYETAASAIWREAASSFAEVEGDTLGSSTARVPGTGGGPTLAVLGHIDEIGLMVTHADERGFLSFLRVGGWRADVLVGQRLELLTSKGSLSGVVGRKASRPLRRGEEFPRVELEDLHLDIGARSHEEALELVAIGDVAVIAGEPVELANGRIASRSLDNRLGAYVALEAARRVADAGGGPGDVFAVAAVQEEIGDFGGARTSVFALEPQVALAVDITGATDAPGGDPKIDGAAVLGAGPILNRGSTIAPRVFDLLVEAAEGEGIPYAVNVSAGSTHTDMDAAYLSRAGIATGLVSIPIRYTHSPVETVALEDVEAAIRLVAAFADRLRPGLELAR
jgi:putative aminopeptidase FrvX